MSADWSHVDSWRKRGDGFLVEISRHEKPLSAWDHHTGPHRWCVYAYVYPSHPHFAAFDGDKLWQPATNMPGLHGGCSYIRRHIGADGAVDSWQVGADYNHLDDEHFTFAAKMPLEVKADAEQLFSWLAERATTAVEQATGGDQ